MLAKRLWPLLFLVIAAFYLYGLGALPLVGPDEPRYAEVAREMLARGDLITPTLGGLEWFEKPPLLYWMMMASYRVFGVNEFAARIGPALCGLLTAVFVYWIGVNVGRCQEIVAVKQGATGEVAERNHKALAHWSVLALLSSIGIISFSRAASFDIVVTMTLTGALACFIVWNIRSARIPASGAPASMPAGHNNKFELVLLLGFYFFIALSLLAKGLIGIVIPLGVIAAYFLLRREWPPRSFAKSLPWGIPVAMAIAAVWYGPMIARHGEKFLDQFIVQHHFARFLTNKYHHPQPFYFYLTTLEWLALPWTIVLVAAFISSRSWKWRGVEPLDRLRVFALAWIVVPVVFFSLSESKLAAYALPVVPAVALLVGERIVCLLGAKRGDRIIQLTGAALLGLAAAGIWYLIIGLGMRPWCAVAMASASAIVGVTALFFPRRRQTFFLLFSFTTLAAAAVALNCAAPIAVRRDSVRDLLTAAAARGYGAAPIVQLYTIERTAEFYGFGRLTYRSDGEPKMLEGASEVIDAAHRNNNLVLCFVPTEHQSQLTDVKQAQTELIGNNGRVSLVLVRVR